MSTTKKRAIKKRGPVKASDPPNNPNNKGSGRKRKINSLGSGAKYFPSEDEGINNYTQEAKGGGISRSVPTDFATFSVYYNPQNVLQTFDAIFSHLLAQAGEKKPYSFQGLATGLDMKITGISVIEELEEEAEPAYIDPEEGPATSPYTHLAMKIFEQKIVYALSSFSDQVMMQVIIATINELNKSGHITLSATHSLKEIWDHYFSSYRKAMQANWAPQKPGRDKEWPPVKLRKLAKAHSTNEHVARKLKSIYESRGLKEWRDREWKNQVRLEYDDLYDWILYAVPGSDIDEIALLLSSKQFNMYKSENQDGVSGIYARLLKARKLTAQVTHDPTYSEEEEDIANSGFSITVSSDNNE
jgi:hypothetical protein